MSHMHQSRNKIQIHSINGKGCLRLPIKSTLYNNAAGGPTDKGAVEMELPAVNDNFNFGRESPTTAYFLLWVFSCYIIVIL